MTAVPSTASRLQELHDTDTSSPDSPRDVGDFMALVKQQLRWEDMLKALKAESQKLEGALKRTGADVRKKLNQKKRDLEAKRSVLQERIRSQTVKVKDRLRNSRRKVQHQLRLGTDKLKINYVKNIRLIDKFGFVFGVLHTWISVFLLASNPRLAVLWLTCWAAALIFVRAIIYRFRQWQYYLFDFCYYSNALLGVYVFFTPGSKRLFTAVFALSNGPILWAIVMWRNSLVFHDLDKCTSLFIHVAGPLSMFCVRWLMPDESLYSTGCNTAGGEHCELDWWSSLGVPTLLYLAWQVFYYAKTEWQWFRISKPLSASDDTIVTSFKFLVPMFRNTALGRLYFRIVPQSSHRARVLGFMAFQMAYTVMTLLPVKWMFENFALHVTVLCCVLLRCLWNGANYYFEVFAKKYEPQASEIDAKVEELRSEHARHKNRYNELFGSPREEQDEWSPR